jgi:3-oxoacyl-[acyl-carrier protein] reductase
MKNKVALITGSSSGIGRQIGIDLLDKDCFVYFNGHTQESTKQLEKEIAYRDCDKDYMPTFDIICQDLSTIESNISLGNYFKEQKRTLDILILNLGITDRTPFGNIKSSKWNKVFETNLSGAFFLVQSLRDIIRPNGKIIFISSISGCTTDSTSIAYGVSKGAIHILVPYLAKEFAEKKITVNAVCPAYIDSNWHKGKSQAQLKRIANKHLAKRLGTTKEVSKAVLSIIDNDFINGSILKVDGGFGLA